MSEKADEFDDEEEPPLPKKAPFVCFTVRFRGQLHTLPADELDALSTVLDLKDLLAEVTGVEPSNQKIMGLCKSPLFKIADDMTLGSLDLKLTGVALVKSCSLMMTGTPSCELAAKKEQELAGGAGGASVVNDLSLEFGPTSRIFRKLQKHTIACELHFINPPRPGKSLLVLDLDHTLLDFSSRDDSVTAAAMCRPFLHEFLELTHSHYDICFWSQTSWKWLEIKMNELCMTGHSRYKISFCLDKTTMFTANEGKVKPLHLLYSKSPPGTQWGPNNTVHVDDLPRNFELNKKNGIAISPFHRPPPGTEPHAGPSDIELVLLGRYLVSIATCPDLSRKPHDNWRAEALALIDQAAANGGAGTGGSVFKAARGPP